jgi:hypothetical protein
MEWRAMRNVPLSRRIYGPANRKESFANATPSPATETIGRISAGERTVALEQPVRRVKRGSALPGVSPIPVTIDATDY